MKLPKKIKVGRKWYAIEPRNSLANGIRARWRSDGFILVGERCSLTGRPYRRKDRSESFWHEVTHAILWEAGYHALCTDEKFVTQFAKLLNNAIHSAQFDAKFDVEKWKRQNL